jgi:tRNA-dependent cyclodipeptide synthase
VFTLTRLGTPERAPGGTADHVLVGLSPWNGRYSPEYIRDLISWLHPRFDTIDVVIPGYEAAYTLIAAGHPPARAVHRARRAYRQLRNPAVRALADLGVADPARHVRSLTRLHAEPAYRESLDRARDAYLADARIRGACRAITTEVVRNAAGGRRPAGVTEIDLAVSYVIAEIPLLTDAPGLFGTRGTVFVYHRSSPLVSAIADGNSTLTAAPGQAWAVVSR